MKKISRRLFLLVFLSACSPFPTVTNPILQDPLPTFEPLPTFSEPSDPLEPIAVPINEVVPNSEPNCHTPVDVPAEPDVIPPPGGVDEATGRHMMGTVQVLDPQSYRLSVTGRVDRPLSLTYDDLRCMSKMTETVTTTCYAFQDTATWSGVLISDVLNLAGVQPGAEKVIQTAADDVTRTVTLDMAMDPHNFLAYQMGDYPLPILFGFPVRSIFIDVAGQYSVKWLTALEVK